MCIEVKKKENPICTPQVLFFFGGVEEFGKKTKKHEVGGEGGGDFEKDKKARKSVFLAGWKGGGGAVCVCVCVIDDLGGDASVLFLSPPPLDDDVSCSPPFYYCGGIIGVKKTSALLPHDSPYIS